MSPRARYAISYALAFIGAVSVGAIVSVLLDSNGVIGPAARAFGFCLTAGFVWMIRVEPSLPPQAKEETHD